MSRPLVTLLTDFGTGSPYVAEMKGVLLSIHSDLQIVDISHAIPPQDIRSAALTWGQVAPSFPAQTIHVCVVDPGVGTDRRLVGLQCGGQTFLGPDNGIFDGILQRWPASEQWELTERRFWREPVSSTFHGRDILAPVAAHCAEGIPLEQFGEPCGGLVRLNWPFPRVTGERIEGECQRIDSFGNVISNIPRSLLDELDWPEWEVLILDRRVTRIVRTYGEGQPGELVALFGSQDMLEIALVASSAARELQAELGTLISVVPSSRA
jgi:S-adenosyl-L-methionine hydrolase (adenosine-forming)